MLTFTRGVDVNIAKLFAALIFGLLLSSCAPAAFEPIADCSGLTGTYVADDYGFSSADGAFEDGPFEDDALEIGFDAGVFDSELSPDFDPVTFGGGYVTTASAVSFDAPFVDNVEPGTQTFACSVVDDDTFTLVSDDIGYDFNDDGVYDDATFTGTFSVLE